MKSEYKNLDILVEFLLNEKIEFTKNFDLKKNSWLKAGGEFQIYIQPKSIIEIKKLVNYFKKEKQKFLIIGNISNTIFRDGLIQTPIINLKKYNFIEKNFLEDKSILLKVSSGVSIFKFSNIVSREFSISGAEGLVGIPGSIGGGIYMNASSYESYLTEYLESIDCINLDGELTNLKKKDLNLGWRTSIIHSKKNLIILNANFRIPLVKKKDKIIIEEKIKRVKSHRLQFQEKKLPNLGSLFATKNLYSDIRNVNFIFFILNLLNTLLTRIVIRFLNKDNLIDYRSIIVKIYSFFLGLDKFKGIRLSDRTINCVVNLNTTSANKVIEFIRKFEKKIKKSQKLENIILDNIE